MKKSILLALFLVTTIVASAQINLFTVKESIEESAKKVAPTANVYATPFGGNSFVLSVDFKETVSEDSLKTLVPLIMDPIMEKNKMTLEVDWAFIGGRWQCAYMTRNQIIANWCTADEMPNSLKCMIRY